MNGLTHKVVGITAVGAVVAIKGPLYAEVMTIPVYTTLMLITAPSGSIMADIDMASTEKGRKYPWVSKLFTHRGFTHTPVVTILPLLLCLLILQSGVSPVTTTLNSLLMGFFIGYASHVIIDTFNYNGCPIFWPIYRKNIYIFRVSTANKFASSLKDKKNNWQEPAFQGIWVLAIVVHVILVLGGITL